MQIDLFQTEPELTLEERIQRLRDTALMHRIEDLLKYGFIYSCTGKARDMAKQIRSKGILCKSINKHTIKILR